ncbi:MAG TPA: penicillin-binding protein, partial [bacterium]|nr:penicillin-binding protein [bacterium]
KYGVDGRYDDILRGKPCQYITAMDALSRPMFLDSSPPPRSPKGADIELTLDEFIQSVAEQELDEACKSSGAPGGCVLVMDPNNGEILAMAQYPRFDPNEYSKYPMANYRNRAISDAFEPGSLAKCFTMYAALAMGVTRPDTVIRCEAGFSVGRKVIKDVPGTRYGDLTATEILAKSNNVGTVKLALQCGEEALYQTFREFGMSGRTGVDLPSEGVCTIPRLSQWSKTTIAVLPYGYEMMATPIGLCRAYAMIANGGRAITPHVVRAVVNNETHQRLEPKQPYADQILSSEKTKMLAEMMTQCIEIGTGRHAKVPGFSGRIAAKSGTAVQLERDEEGRGRGYSKDKVVASFIGFLPVEAPRAVISVHIWEPDAEGPTHGGELAGPVFAKLADYVATRMNMPRNTSEIETPTSTPNSLAINKQKNQTPTPSVKDYLDQGVMPDVKGMTKGQVYELLKTLNLEGRFEGFGLACSQQPEPGESLEQIQVCHVNFSDEQLR